ncbi:sigma-70 family RNA polymerase sigma factor [Nocardiopsis sp. EMB25]|uniref:RNA polymerase sigma factor n=1 Tax=Nocardiopsis sp. EMB25 TaxID=2835867 RepID=UPI002283F3C3|nr:sigma-70 family RNA polymerase sigma factor [Nocardiopsis sp. EMB25]MCY9782349.1 sigma-70 family RNA polymerase sigma factor [Nocardiopsis sp. EMB25]
MTRGIESDEPTPEAVEQLYDAFAPALYRYAWSLLGGGADPNHATEPVGGTASREAADRVAEAVHDGLVASVVLADELADPADRGPWLYALVRSACQRRGFALTCPYTRLATMPAEAPAARMFARLPASHRELVELNLRHALPVSAIARILGLDTQLCGELSRSAIRRAADGLSDLDGNDGERPDSPAATWRARVQEVSFTLALLRPPGPPPGLRDLVVRTCVDPDHAERRERIGAAMHPLTSDGYPVHRARASEDVEEPAPEPAEPAAEQLPRALPGDRVTTRDHPVRAETTTPLPGPSTAPGAEDDGASPRRWPLPAVSGVITVVLAVALWWWASALGAPSTIIGTDNADAERSPMTQDLEAASTTSDGRPVAEPDTGAPDQAHDPQSGHQRGDDAAPSGHPTKEPVRGTEQSDPPPQAPSPSPSEAPSSPSPEESGGTQDEDPSQNPEDESTPVPDGEKSEDGLFDGLLDFLFGDG